MSNGLRVVLDLRKDFPRSQIIRSRSPLLSPPSPCSQPVEGGFESCTFCVMLNQPCIPSPSPPPLVEKALQGFWLSPPSVWHSKTPLKR